MVEVGFDRKSLIINGERRLILSGAMHYYRLPSPEIWRHRLRRMKELGLDTVDVYFYWGYHSPAPGVYDFSGFRDVDRLLDMIEEEGLYLMARPGPYICSEVDGGGFPAWLLTKPGLKLRCRENARFVYDPEYMKYAREWWEQIVPRIARRDNLILFQIENEYHFMPTPKGALLALQKTLQRRMGTNAIFNLQMRKPVKAVLQYLQKRAMRGVGYKQSNRYMKELYAWSRELGVTVPIFHNDIEGAMQRFVDADIAGIDDYPIKTFDVDWQGRDHVFGTLDLMEQGHAALGKDCPLLIGELQGGWFDPWGGKGFAVIRRRLGPAAIDMTLKTALSQGAGVISVFMTCGGTSFGHVASPDVYTSYDYGAPISEGGRPTARGEAMKRFVSFARRHEKELLESEAVGLQCAISPRLHCISRRTPSGKRFIYIRNGGKTAESIMLGPNRIGMSPSTMMVLVVNDQDEVLDRCDPATDTAEYVFPYTELPKLSPWKFGIPHLPLDPDYDDSDWTLVPAGQPLDIDSIGVHYGFVWYRARLKDPISGFKLDARHCWAAYFNGRLLAAFDNHKNRLATGDDMAETVDVRIPRSDFVKGGNVLTVLCESLGHNKGFLEDLHNKRGIVSFRAGRNKIDWRVRGGLLPGEIGMTPRADFSALRLSGEEEVETPHEWPANKHGIGLYQTRFSLDLEGPDNPPLGLDVPSADEKAVIYLNGWLLGRFWGSAGPQMIYYLPPGLLNWKGENHLAIALWRWEQPGRIGRVHLEIQP
ncbi:MAG TPA: beta-galactosidase [bacterium]|nr:beta-galactosidase [bacterium]